MAACKGTRALLRRTGRGGTAVPGDVAMKFADHILEAVSEGMEIVVVTGTNGKTTTCSMIEHAVTACGKACLLNRSGANLLSGITADLTCNATATGKPKNTLKEIRKGVEKVPETILVLNAEEPLSASLSLGTPNPVIWYGMDKSVGVQGNVDLKDALVCPRCGSEYTYDYHVYAHLGGFACPGCGYRRAEPDVAVTKILRIAPDGSTAVMRIGGKEQEVKIAVPAVYNVYNAAAAISAVKALGLPVSKAAAASEHARTALCFMVQPPLSLTAL